MMLPRRNERGFTLIEMLIVVTILAILAAVGYPSYRDQVLKSRRTDAMAALTTAAQLMERCFTASMPQSYANCTVPTQSPEGYYSISAQTTATTFTLTAAPTSKGNQSDDTECGSFTLNQAGAKGATGSSPENCWT